MKSRQESLMPYGIPRYIRCYDNGGDTVDRFTVVFTKKTYRVQSRIFGIDKRYSSYIAMSSNPFHPQGIYQHEESDGLIDRPCYKHLGKKISFDMLPPDCQKAVIQDYKEIWGFK